MIAHLRGTIAAREPVLVVEVGGVGFAVHVSARTAATLPPAGAPCVLQTYLHVREDQLALYGFATESERALFVQLLVVNGIGPRAALTLLSSAPHEELLRALGDGDEDYLVRLPGVGRKTAARLVLELQGKVAAPTTVTPTGDARLDEAVLALVSLGLTQRAARDAVDRVRGGGLAAAARVEDVVKAALQAGGRGGA